MGCSPGWDAAQELVADRHRKSLGEVAFDVACLADMATLMVTNTWIVSNFATLERTGETYIVVAEACTKATVGKIVFESEKLASEGGTFREILRNAVT